MAERGPKGARNANIRANKGKKPSDPTLCPILHTYYLFTPNLGDSNRFWPKKMTKMAKNLILDPKLANLNNFVKINFFRQFF